MKNIINISKRGIIAILLLCTILGVAGIGVHATAMVEGTTAVTEETTQELMPMMASRCSSYVKFNVQMANAVAQYHGYAGAEALKHSYGVSSNANMYRNTVTHEIVLITNKNAVINTGLFGGW